MSNFTYFRDDHAVSMKLRDYFAAQAMAALIVHTPYDKILNNSGLSFDAYKLADAMMEARDQ